MLILHGKPANLNAGGKEILLYLHTLLDKPQNDIYQTPIRGILFPADTKFFTPSVRAPDKSKGYREQQIDISYGLVGILPASLLNNLQNVEIA